MGAVLAVLEQRNGKLKPVSAEVLSAARKLAAGTDREVHALVVGPPALALTDLHGPDRIYVAATDELRLYQADAYAQIAVDLAKSGGHEAVILAATAAGRDLAPRIAAGLEAALVTGIGSLSHDDGVVVQRADHAGKVLRTVRVHRTPCVLTVRPRAFPPIEGSAATTVEREDVPLNGAPAGLATTVEVTERAQASASVDEAAVVVSGGRGLRGPENFTLIENLAAALNGAVGASRAVVDVGWRPHAEQVGQTGKTVAPDLYIAVGISGAIQHVAGMRSAKVIVAINKDPGAPIFKLADYGIVGDLFEIVPKLTEAVQQLRES
jgi:electron transfer flavoprotein alpha subunit